MDKTFQYEKMFRALGDGHRLVILDQLTDREMNAGEILETVDVVQSTLSHHMKTLCDSGLVNARRSGKWTCYSINTEAFKAAEDFLLRLRLREENRLKGSETPEVTVLDSGKTEHPEKQMKSETLEKPEAREKQMKPETLEKPEAREKQSRLEKATESEVSEKQDKPDKTAKSEKAVKPGKTPKADKPEKSEKSDKPVKTDYSEKREKAVDSFGELAEAEEIRYEIYKGFGKKAKPSSDDQEKPQKTKERDKGKSKEGKGDRRDRKKSGKKKGSKGKDKKSGQK